MIFLCLLVSVSLTFARPKPSEVLHVVNDASTLDTDGNGIYDFQDCLNYWYSLYHDTSNVCRISTSIDYVTQDNAQEIHWDKLSIDFDTSAKWGSDVAVSLAGGKEYPLDELCAWYEADSVNRWGKVKYPILWMGFPPKLRGNAQITATPGSNPDSSVYKSMPCALVMFLRPGCDAAQSDALTPWAARAWLSSSMYGRASTAAASPPAVAGQSEIFFNPGVDYICQPRNVSAGDTLRIWVLPTVMDADSVTYLRRALLKSTQSPIKNGSAQARHWMVIDETNSNGSDVLYSTTGAASAGYRNNVARVFGTHVLCDDDSMADADKDASYLGWTGEITLRSGDSCLVFFNSGDTHTPKPDSSANWYRQLTFPIANGALTWSSESYFGYSTRGYLRPTGTLTQSATSDALKVGFTYVLANSHEPLTMGLINDRAVGYCLTKKDVPFAVFAWSVQPTGYHENLPIGNPIGVINASESESTWDNWSKW